MKKFIKLLNVEDNIQEYNISISPNLGKLKATSELPNHIIPSIANIKDALNHEIRVFLKTNEESHSGTLMSMPPILDANPIGGGTIMKKREINEINNSIFKQKMKQTMMSSVINSEENLTKLEHVVGFEKKDCKTNFFNKRFIPSNQTSPNIFSIPNMIGSSYLSLNSLSNEGGYDTSAKIKSRVEMIKTYQRISENELLLRSLDEIESVAMEIQDKRHTMGNND